MPRADLTGVSSSVTTGMRAVVPPACVSASARSNRVAGVVRLFTRPRELQCVRDSHDCRDHILAPIGQC